jgi:beta-ureidopropionase
MSVGRSVSVGIVQAAWTGDATSMLDAQESHLRDAAARGAQIVCFQELFNAPFFAQQQRSEYYAYAELVPEGPTVARFRAVGAELGVVLVLPLFERTAVEGLYYNTAAVIDADGTFLGSYRKHHIPNLPGFWEKFYFRPGDTGFPVFDTAVGRVGVYICYDRHFPEGWRALGLGGAEIVFNPSATSRALSAHLWHLEQAAAAAANGYYVAAINRVGSEPEYGDNEYYGTSYIADPRGQLVGASASTDADEALVRELDLDLIREVRRTWQWYRDRRPDAYEALVR